MPRVWGVVSTPASSPATPTSSNQLFDGPLMLLPRCAANSWRLQSSVLPSPPAPALCQANPSWPGRRYRPSPSCIESWAPGRRASGAGFKGNETNPEGGLKCFSERASGQTGGWAQALPGPGRWAPSPAPRALPSSASLLPPTALLCVDSRMSQMVVFSNDTGNCL